MSKARRRFSREFKLEAVRQLATGLPLVQVARELGVDAQVIARRAGFFKTSGGLLREGHAMKYRAILTTPSSLSIHRRCRLLGVGRSGFYAWCGRPASARAATRHALVAAIRDVHEEVDRTYGSPRMHVELQARGWRCGRHHVARVMRAAGLRAKQARRVQVTTVRDPSRPAAPNLLARQFVVARYATSQERTGARRARRRSRSQCDRRLDRDPARATAPIADLGPRGGNGTTRAAACRHRRGSLFLRSAQSMAARLKREYQRLAEAVLPERHRFE